MRLSFYSFIGISLLFSVLTSVICKGNVIDTLLIKKRGVLIGAKHTGLGIGNVDTLRGLRLNWRDESIKQIEGINLSGWIPKSNPNSSIKGFGLGLMPEASQLEGVFAGLLGVSGQSISGIATGVVGVGSVNAIKGLSLGGLGIASNQSTITGIQVAGFGIGSAKGLKGISIAGLGLGSGGDIQGINLAGIGMGTSSGKIRGLNVAGIGIGSDKDIQGVTLAGIGTGSGGTISGVSLSGIGSGSDKMKGLHLAGVGIGASTIKGLAIAGIGIGGVDLSGVYVSGIGTGAKHITGLSLAGIAQGGEALKGLFISPLLYAQTFEGFSIAPILSISRQNKGIQVATISVIRCTEHYKMAVIEIAMETTQESCEAINEGVQLGLYNYSRKMGDKAWQIGLINYVKENRKGLRVLPFFNRKFE